MYVHRKIHLKNINLHTSYYDLSTDYARFIYYILFSYGLNYNSVFQDIITLLEIYEKEKKELLPYKYLAWHRSFEKLLTSAWAMEENKQN